MRAQARARLQHIRFSSRKAEKAEKTEIICENRCVLQHISDYISDFPGFSGFGSRDPDVLECEPRPGPVSNTSDFVPEKPKKPK